MVIDTHIWIWWVQGAPQLGARARAILTSAARTGIAVSAISCWEVAKLVQLKRLVLPVPTIEWLRIALNHPGVRLVELTPAISVEATQLPGLFHRDPADQLIVATARVLDVPLLTADAKILAYEHVRQVSFPQ
jgi:PIN domain nuclease of toxin-antitoxin system